MEKKYGGFIVKENIIENQTLPQDYSQEYSLVSRSITSYTNNMSTTVGQRYFQSNSVIILHTEYDENGKVIKQEYDTATNWNTFASQLRRLG